MVVTHFLCTLFDWVVYFFSSSCGKETGGRLDLGIPVSALQSILACSLDLIITWPPQVVHQHPRGRHWLHTCSIPQSTIHMNWRAPISVVQVRQRLVADQRGVRHLAKGFSHPTFASNASHRLQARADSCNPTN